MPAIRIDGKALAAEQFAALRARIQALQKPPRLVVVASDGASESSFIRAKRAAGTKIGVAVDVVTFAEDVSIGGMRSILNAVVKSGADGIVVQLPMPNQLDQSRHALLQVIPEDLDVDCISERWLGRLMSGRMTLTLKRGQATLLPPVVGALATIIEKENIVLAGKRIVVVGWGDLVGKPVAIWLISQGATVSVATKTEQNLKNLVGHADILVSGAGQPGLITGEMIAEGAIIFDAGTSEASGAVVGDVDVKSAEARSSLYTPVPGGIGPLTVSALYANLVALCEARRS